MTRKGALISLLMGISLTAFAKSPSSFVTTYSQWVNEQGDITLPDDYATRWVFLGTWSVAEKDVEHSGEASGHGAAGLHNVYTQPGVVEYFREHGSFPDGAILVKELLKGVTTAMTTGTVSRADEYEGAFIMIKDTQDRFADNPLWGDGWGWALFAPESSTEPTTKAYKAECLGCHIPAKDRDWIYTEGYPLLKVKD